MDDFVLGWLIGVYARGYLIERVVCGSCLDDSLVVYKRRSVPSTCSVCGAVTR